MDRLGASSVGPITGRRRSFEELVRELRAEEEFNEAGDEDNASSEPAWLFYPPNIVVSKRPFWNERERFGSALGIPGLSALDAIAAEKPKNHVTATTSRPLISPAQQSPTAPLDQLARLLGRSWARDRRVRMGEGLGWGMGLLRRS